MSNLSDKELLDLIDNTIADTHYIKDDLKPTKSIYKIFSLWTIFYIITSIFILVYNKLGVYLELYLYDWYFPTTRISSILLLLLTLFAYFILIRKIKGSIKEKDFLMLYSVIPIILILSRLAYPLSYYVNTELIIRLYETIPIDLIAIVIGAVLLNYYYKSNFTKKLIYINIIILILNVLIFSLYSYGQLNNDILTMLEKVFETCRNNGVIVILNYLVIVFSLKRMVEKND